MFVKTQNDALHDVPYPVSTDWPMGPLVGDAASTTDDDMAKMTKATASMLSASLNAPLTHFLRLKSLKVR